jgi:hypothetical protein
VAWGREKREGMAQQCSAELGSARRKHLPLLLRNRVSRFLHFNSSRTGQIYHTAPSLRLFVVCHPSFLLWSVLSMSLSCGSVPVFFHSSHHSTTATSAPSLISVRPKQFTDKF